MFKRLLVALDGSAAAESALRYAGELGASGEVVLLRAVPLMAGLIPAAEAEAAPSLADVDAAMDALRRDADAYLEAVAARLRSSGIRASPDRAEGDAATTIKQRARDIGADLILITTHGHGGLGRVLFGSTAEAVLRDAPCPVLVIPIR